MILKTGKPVLSLQQVFTNSKYYFYSIICFQFILRQEVKNLYREILKTIRKVPRQSDQNDLKEWAKRDFRSNSNVQDEITIRMHLNYGKRCLKELQNSLALSG